MGNANIVGTINQNSAFDDLLNLGETVMRNMNQHNSLVRFLTLWVRITSNSNATFRQVGVASGYQVPVGKAFRGVATKSNMVGTGTTNYWGLNVGTSDIGFNSASAASGLVLTVDNPLIQNYFAAAAQQASARSLIVVPAGKYIQAYTSASIYVMLFGYEVDLTVTNF